MQSNGSIDWIDRDRCTGCLLCMAICPQKAVTMKYNNEGFIFPQIEKNKCINCGLCLNNCPLVRSPQGKETIEKKILQLKDTNYLRNSASGGAAFGLAEVILRMKGSVAGCVLDNNMLPVHILSNKFEDIIKMQGSKYVQSKMTAEIYQAIKTKVLEGEKVLFIGTPCQVAGVLNICDKTTDNLFTMELICHGVTSPGLYRHYIESKAREIGGQIEEVQFRSRKFGRYPQNHSIRIKTTCNEYCVHALDDPYGSSFYHNRILRESCYQCPFASQKRIADLTIGDYDVPDDIKNDFPSELGFSAVLINSGKGRRLVEQALDLFESHQIETDYAPINLIQPTMRPKERDKMRDMHSDIDNPCKDIGFKVRITIKDRIKRHFPQSIKDKIKKQIWRLKA